MTDAQYKYNPSEKRAHRVIEAVRELHGALLALWQHDDAEGHAIALEQLRKIEGDAIRGRGNSWGGTSDMHQDICMSVQILMNETYNIGGKHG